MALQASALLDSPLEVHLLWDLTLITPGLPRHNMIQFILFRMALQEETKTLRERLTAAEAEVSESTDALRLTKEDAAAELAENNAALAAASAELQELRDVHHDVSK